MKNLILITLGFLLLFFLAVGVILYMPFQGGVEKGPKAHFRVEEGVVEVFGASEGKIHSLLGTVTPGKALTVPTVSASSLKVPFWLSWLEPVVVDIAGRARYFMYKEGKKTKKREFTVGYTNQTIRKGFIQELETSRLVKSIQLDFYSDGFLFYAKAFGISLTCRGILSTTNGTEDKLFLRLQWLKVGPFSMPPHILRAMENLFSNAYTQSGNFSIRLVRISFGDGSMIMSFQKMAGADLEGIN